MEKVEIKLSNEEKDKKPVKFQRRKNRRKMKMDF
jgi:hypothetical protein